MIYFYGGAFNPLTNTHLTIIKNIISILKTDDILVIGITDHNYKIFEFPYTTRFSILYENLIEFTTNKNIKIIKQDERTWKFLNKHFPNENITLVLGEDEYIDLLNEKWHFSKDILNTYNIKVIPRTDGISATKVRELLKNNASNEELLKYVSNITLKIIKEEE